jgi:two-component sensor histidine kinase
MPILPLTSLKPATTSRPKKPAKPGLGISIVQALSAQLHGVVTVADANPGTSVSIAHTHVAALRSVNDTSSAARAI